MSGSGTAGEDPRARELSRRVVKLEAELEITRRLAGFESPAPERERERIYRFIESEAANFAVRTLCKVTKVSSSAYYAWRARGEAPARQSGLVPLPRSPHRCAQDVPEGHPDRAAR